MIDHRERIDHVAHGLRHLLALVEQKSVPEHALGQRDACRHQKSRPIDGVKPHNVLANHMQIRWPILPKRVRLVGKAERGNVIGERIDPDIHDMGLIAGDLDPPIEGGA